MKGIGVVGVLRNEYAAIMVVMIRQRFKSSKPALLAV